MAKLISVDDRFVLKDTKFVKNASYYKDMFAFLDAYNSIITKPKEQLPNYCFKNDDSFCLEGVCLIMRDYASEFNFESSRLTLDYLKVLYYTIASFSIDENMPDKSLIESEFNEYKNASKELSISSKAEFDKQTVLYNDAKRDYDKTSALYAKNLVIANVLNIIAIFVLVFSFGLAIIPFSIYSFGKLSLAGSSIIAVFALAIGFLAYYLMERLSKYLESKAGEIAYILQQKKRAKNEVMASLQRAKAKYSKILSEKYEYNNNFSDSLKPYVNTLDIDEILLKASEYKLLSYNLTIDIANLFESQQNSVQEIVKRIETIPKGFEQAKALTDIYLEISSSDWLFYNNEVRFAFLKKFSENAEKTYNWKLNINQDKINPFGVNIKALAKEQISYLKNDDSLFVSASLDKFLNTNYIRNTKALELKDIKNIDALKNVKMEFLTKFYDYEKTKVYDNLFYDKKLTDGAVVTPEIRENTQKIPTFVLMKLKYIECKMGFENSGFDIISQINEDINKKKLTVAYNSVEYSEDTDDLVSDFITEDFGDYIRYNVGGNVFIGYKFV